MIEYTIGQQGMARFKFIKKGFKADIEAHVIIIAVDKKMIWIRDSDDYEYLVKREQFYFL